MPASHEYYPRRLLFGTAKNQSAKGTSDDPFDTASTAMAWRAGCAGVSVRRHDQQRSAIGVEQLIGVGLAGDVQGPGHDGFSLGMKKV